MNRDVMHVQHYISTEFNTDCAIGGDNQLIMRGRFTVSDIEKTLKKYIIEYVQCNSCKSTNTTLNKDPSTRSYYKNCNACESRKTVQTIKSGYHALGKGGRKG